MIETDRVKNYIIYNVSGKNDDSFNTIFLIGEKNGNVSNFSGVSGFSWLAGDG